jgi:hypothetical protein
MYNELVDFVSLNRMVVLLSSLHALNSRYMQRLAASSDLRCLGLGEKEF